MNINRIIYLFITINSFLILNGQTNLVNNPSFEDTVVCPTYPGNIFEAQGWYSSRNTPDYFNSCANSAYPDMGTPVNFPGNQYPYHGNAYAGLGTFRKTISNAREYMSTQLISQLVIGTKYYASAFISRADTILGTENWTGSSNKFGFKFTTYYQSSFPGMAINNFSHVRSDSIIKDKYAWSKIFGEFIADSSYKYLSIGNFYTDANTDTFKCVDVAYYYIDLVCVSTSSLTSIEEPQNSYQFKIYPNPSSETFNFELYTSSQIVITNIIGEEILNERRDKGKQKINLQNQVNGIYFLKVLEDRKQYVTKIIKE